ncbi:Cellulose biosynthesis protein BcsQ [Paramicrobacterium humi]|uniref:Cellulose biosynthesis protein BcsQ n=1 Tax=Paramicrobacterium humi TaxID=640635 RepID=A0A1H4P4U7_9MICO|nr:P-loop NTPase [Microbacterium humi]SEC02354.1 Cellulose biosynthesis protein BcsQ [Microbacterium humi]
MVRLVIALDRDTEERLIEGLLERGHDILARLGAFDDIAAAIERTAPDVLLIDAEMLDAELLGSCDGDRVRVVALTGDEEQRRKLARLGLREHAAKTAALDAIDDLLTGAVLESGDADAPQRGSVTAVWGPAGAPGRSTVAIGLALELASAGGRVALVDADTWGASIAPMLGMLDESPGFAAACRLAGQGALTTEELERVSQRYPVSQGSLSVLTGLTRTSRWPELTEERVRLTLEVCRTWAEHIIVDTGFSLESDEEISSDLFAPRRNAATLTCLRGAERVIAVGRADPIGLGRLLRQHPDLLDVVEGVPVRVVINRVRSGPIGVGAAAQITRTLERFGGIEKPLLIAHDERAADAAALEGRSLREVAPRSPAAVAIRRLAREIMPDAAMPPCRRAVESVVRGADCDGSRGDRSCQATPRRHHKLDQCRRSVN